MRRCFLIPCSSVKFKRKPSRYRNRFSFIRAYFYVRVRQYIIGFHQKYVFIVVLLWCWYVAVFPTKWTQRKTLSVSTHRSDILFRVILDRIWSHPTGQFQIYIHFYIELLYMTCLSNTWFFFSSSCRHCCVQFVYLLCIGHLVYINICPNHPKYTSGLVVNNERVLW